MAQHKLQADPGEITWHEGNVWQEDSNTPNAETEPKGDDDELVSGVNLLAKIGVHIGKVEEESRKTNQAIGQLARAIERNTPVDATSVASGNFVTGTPLVLNLGKPDKGTFWEVGVFSIGGNEVNISAAGTWGLYTSAYPNLGGAGLGNLVDVGGSMPGVFNYSTAQLVVPDGQFLFAIVFGGTNGQGYVCRAGFRVYNVIASQGQVTFGL